MLSGLDSSDMEAGRAANYGSSSSKPSLPIYPYRASLCRADSRGAGVLVKRYVLALGSLHLTLMAAVGVWLWLDPKQLGLGNRHTAEFRSANSFAVEKATVAIMGHAFPFSSPGLRIGSLATYFLFLTPGINLIAPMMLFLLVYFGCHRISLGKRWEALPAYIGLGILAFINIVFVVDIELTWRLNTRLQEGGSGVGIRPDLGYPLAPLALARLD
jgi:hypothetical protein